MFCRGRWKGRKSLPLLTSAIAVWRLSSELDFFRPNVGPSSTGAAGAAAGAAGSGIEEGWMSHQSVLTHRNSAFPHSARLLSESEFKMFLPKKDHRFINEADIDSESELEKYKTNPQQKAD